MVKELMLELLTYEPFEKFLPVEKIYIDNILSGNYQQPQSMLHDLFSGFHCCVQQEAFDDVDWLRQWKAAYGYTRLPLLFKKICFYLMVKGTLSGSDFMKRIGLQVTRFRKWKISPQFRRYAEADTYSVIRSFRNGTKKEYVVSIVKKLYYEAGRQVSQSTVLKELPKFVDVFAGTASVAASMVSDGCPPPIVNDYDPVMVCFAWAFTYHQKELRSKIARLHNWLMKLNFESIDWCYGEDAYEDHYGFMDSLMRLKPDEYWEDKSKKFWKKEMLTNPKIWDNFAFQWGRSKSAIAAGKKKAQRHKEFIIKIRSSYLAAKKELESCDRATLRCTNFNALPKNAINDQIDAILEFALAVFYYYSFKPLGKSVFHEACVDERNYYSFINRMRYQKAAKGKDQADQAWKLTRLRLRPASLRLESTGDFSKHLRNAEFYSEDFRSILKNGPSDRVYYLDSPYFLTVGYDVGFSDDDHKDMLGILQGAEFKWIFSMQYNPSARNTCTDESKRRHRPIIRDYGAYYRGFFSPLQLDAAQRVYIQTDISKKAASKLFAILFDFDAVRKKWPKMNRPTSEMLVVNFDCLRAIPLHDRAVVYPFDLFLKCADKGFPYSRIVQKAIARRKRCIKKNFAGAAAV